MSEAERQYVPSTGRALMVVSVAVFAAVTVATALEDWPQTLWAATWPAALTVLAVVAGVRPAVWVEGDQVAVRMMASTLWIPAAAIKSVAVQQTLVMRVGDQLIRSSAVGRGVRQAAQQSLRRPGSRLEPEVPKVRHDPPSLAEELIKSAAANERARFGWDVFHDSVHELGSEVRREWSWPMVALIAVSLALPLVSLVV